MTKERAGVHCLLIDPHGNITMIACHLEFECTNNVAESGALMQGLIKSRDLHVKCIEVFGDSQIVAYQVRNLINFTSNHLNTTSERYGNLLINLKILILNPYLIL